MSEMQFSAPSSLFYYYDNQKALDVLDGQKNPPLTFTMEKVISFYKAKANLEVCKYEFYDFMCKFYKAVWGTACEKLTGIEPLPFRDVKESSIEDVWGNDEIYWVYKYGNYRLWLGCQVVDVYKLSIYYSVDDGSDNWTVAQSLKLNSIWEIEDEGMNIRIKDIKTLRFSKEVPVVKLKNLSIIATESLETTKEFIDKLIKSAKRKAKKAAK